MWKPWMKPRACPQNETEHKIQPREALIKHDSWFIEMVTNDF